MNIKLVAYGIARDILADKHVEFDFAGDKISELKSALFSRYPKLDELKSIRFAINDEYVEDDQQISQDQEVILIPPVSGG